MKRTALALTCTLALTMFGCSESADSAAGPDPEVFTVANTATTHVDGMTCASCEGAVCSAIEGIDGVKDAYADAKTGEVKIALEEGATLDTEAVKQAVTAANKGQFTIGEITLPAAETPGPGAGDATPNSGAALEPEPGFYVATYKVQGMTCDHCTQAVSNAVAQIDGVNKCSADYSTGRVQALIADGKQISIDKVAEAVKSAGFKLAQ